jgi:hypothetical protein
LERSYRLGVAWSSLEFTRQQFIKQKPMLFHFISYLSAPVYRAYIITFAPPIFDTEQSLYPSQKHAGDQELDEPFIIIAAHDRKANTTISHEWRRMSQASEQNANVKWYLWNGHP